MMSHALETYFPGAPNTPLQDRWVEGLLRTVIEATPRALTNPNSDEARETLMYCSTMALNRFVSIGTLGDWAAHSVEHAVSAVYDIPHGGGLIGGCGGDLSAVAVGPFVWRLLEWVEWKGAPFRAPQDGTGLKLVSRVARR